jgi:thiol-disulfide isomerase/thioredoxin
MKKIIISCLLLILSLSLYGQEKLKKNGVIFQPLTLAQALDKATVAKKNAPRIVFVDCYTTWCGPCKYMTDKIFPMEHVGDYFNSNFICLKIDIEKGEGIDIAEKYKVTVYPTFLILDPKGNEVNRVLGCDDADRFIQRVKDALHPESAPVAKRAEYDRKKTFTAAMEYLKSLEMVHMEKEITSFVAEIFDSLSVKNRYSDLLWPYIIKAIYDPVNPVFEKLINEKSIADKYLSRDVVDKTIREVLMSYSIRYLTGSIKNADVETVLKKTSYLTFVAGNEAEVPFTMEIVLLFSENKINEIGDMLNLILPGPMNDLSEQSRKKIENTIFSVKGLPNETKIKYMGEKADCYIKLAEETRKMAEMLPGK